MSLGDRSCSPHRGLVNNGRDSYSRRLWKQCGRRWEDRSDQGLREWLISEQVTNRPDPSCGKDQASPKELRFQKPKNFIQKSGR